MRIVPIAYNYSSGANNSKNVQTRFESNGYLSQRNNSNKYTGEVSYDLAYASMFDSKIAKDLKLMGLI